MVRISNWYINPKYVEYINLAPIGGVHNDKALQGVRVTFSSGNAIVIYDEDTQKEYDMSAQEFAKKFIVNDRY